VLSSVKQRLVMQPTSEDRRDERAGVSSARLFFVVELSRKRWSKVLIEAGRCRSLNESVSSSVWVGKSHKTVTFR